MDAASDFQEFSVSDLVTVRLLQLYTYARDLDASDDADRWLVEHAHEHNISDADELLAAPAKRAGLHELVTSTVGWAKQLDLPAHLAGVADLGLTTNLAEDVKALLRVQAGLVGHAVTRAVLLEADDAAIGWPKGSSWIVNRFETVAEGARWMEPTVTGDVVEELFRAHKRAAKRIRRDAISSRSPDRTRRLRCDLLGPYRRCGGRGGHCHRNAPDGPARCRRHQRRTGMALAEGVWRRAGWEWPVVCSSQAPPAHLAGSASRSLLGIVVAKQSAAAFVS